MTLFSKPSSCCNRKLTVSYTDQNIRWSAVYIKGCNQHVWSHVFCNGTCTAARCVHQGSKGCRYQCDKCFDLPMTCHKIQTQVLLLRNPDTHSAPQCAVCQVFNWEFSLDRNKYDMSQSARQSCKTVERRAVTSYIYYQCLLGQLYMTYICKRIFNLWIYTAFIF